MSKVKDAIKEKPILSFKSKKQLNDCLEYWQDKLFLNHWIIRARTATLEEVNEGVEGATLCGKNQFVYENNSSLILIVNPEDLPDCIVKSCAEETLVHELLHLKYNLMSPKDRSIESGFYEATSHQFLEQMAKSLIMVKYSLPFSWFKNF